MKTLLSTLAVLFAMSCTGAHAQNTVQVVGTFVKAGSPPPADAVAESKVFAAIAPKFPMKEKQWKWVIVADDALWQRMMVHMGFPGDASVTYYGQTDLEGHTTYFRGSTFLHPDQPAASPEHVISHEMAHVYLHSKDEVLVDRTADEWMKAATKGPSVVVANEVSTTK